MHYMKHPGESSTNSRRRASVDVARGAASTEALGILFSVLQKFIIVLTVINIILNYLLLLIRMTIIILISIAIVMLILFEVRFQ